MIFSKPKYRLARSLAAQVIVVSWAVLLGVQGPLAVDGPRLKPPLIEPDHSVQVELTNAAATNYVIQATANFLSWFTAGSGYGSNGLLVVHHAAASNYPSLFYRSLRAAPPVFPRLNTNQSALTLVMTNGGHCLLYAPDGMRIELIVPPMTLPDPTLISLTLVTNITGLPFSRGLVGAVFLEPMNLPLWGAAQLEITLPDGIDRRELLAYRFQTNGLRFAGMPSQILTNRIRIPITELGGYGVSLATTLEAAAFFSQPVTPAAASSGSNLPSLKANAIDCQPGEQATAETARQQIGDALDQRSHAFAHELGLLRQQELLGFQTDTLAMLTQALENGSCGFYASMIAPRWVEAQQNCALAHVLMQFALGLERQRQLLGVADDPACNPFEAMQNCALIQNCLQEVRDCCATVKGPAKIATVLGLVRQDALLGTDCLSAQAIDDVMRECSSNMWIGTFAAKEFGSVTTTSDDTTEVDEHNIQFEGSVLESRETDYGAAGKSIELIVVGNYSARDYSGRTTSTSSTCLNGKTSKSFILDATEYVASMDSTYRINITLAADGTYNLFAGHMHEPASPFVPSRGYFMNYRRLLDCDGQVFLDNNLTPKESFFYGPNAPYTQGGGSSNQISGTLTIPNPAGTPPTTPTFKWSFRRVSGAGL